MPVMPVMSAMSAMSVFPSKILPEQRSVTEVVNHSVTDLVTDIVSRVTTRALCALVLGVAVFATPVAHASDDDGAVATIQAATVKQVLQDEVRVTFSTQATGTTAPEVNRKLAAALDGARNGFQVPEGVEVSTGNFSVFLDYGKDNQPKGWTGRASLAVVSTNLDEASTVIEHFGKTLAVSSLRFSLSREARQAYEKQMMKDLAGDFADRAKAATEAFGFEDYDLIGLDFTGGANFSPRPMMQRMDAVSMRGEAGPDLSLEPSMTEVEISVTGQIRMK